jgi:fluoroacetyl-CoA thioesterase
MTQSPIMPGWTASVTHQVDPADTAREVGSGSFAVLGTPRLLAWMEAASCLAIANGLGVGETSVGTRMTLEHLKASPIGAMVTVQAMVQHVDGRLVRFEVVAMQSEGQLLGRAEVTRVVVDEQRFLARLQEGSGGGAGAVTGGPAATA